MKRDGLTMKHKWLLEKYFLDLLVFHNVISFGCYSVVAYAIGYINAKTILCK